MKNLTVLALFVSTLGMAQVKTTTQDGNFYALTTWDCFCLPAIGDTLIINHNVSLNGNLYYTSGHIEINGSLLDDGANRDVWIDGGSMENNGSFDAYRLYISIGTLDNNGTIVYLDSLWNKGTLNNAGTLNAYDVLTDQLGMVNSAGLLNIDNNFNNQGVFDNQGTIDVGNNFSNCNIQSMNALFNNDGVICIGNDFTNCNNDTIDGSGIWYIGNLSSNLGRVDGNGVFNTPTGSFNLNSGTVSGSVTFGTSPCNLSTENTEVNDFSVYPNPASSIIKTNYAAFDYVIYDYSGKMVDHGYSEDYQIIISHLEDGIYWLRVLSVDGQSGAVKFIKR